MSKFSVIVFLFVAAVIVAFIHFLYLCGFSVGKLTGHSFRYMPWGVASLVFLVLYGLIISYGYFIGRFKLDVNPVEYCNSQLPPAFDGYRIVHISDLHLNTFDDNPKALSRFVDSINAQAPDLICFTGDLVTLGVKEGEPYVNTLKRLKAKDGVLSVLGNHDFLIYSREYSDEAKRARGIAELVEFQRSLGWKLLRNENIVIPRGGDSITFIGVDNHSCKDEGFHSVKMGDLPAAMRGTNGFRILLSHDPTHWRAEVVPQTDIPLTLSGHTHAGQMRMFGKSAASFSFDETDGMYREGNQSLYINIGLGCTLPLRIGANAEITIITLKKGSE